MRKEVFKAINHLESEISELDRVIDDAGTYMKDVQDALKEVHESLDLDVIHTPSRVLYDFMVACTKTLKQFKSYANHIPSPIYDTEAADHKITKTITRCLVDVGGQCHNQLESRLGVTVEASIPNEMACVADDYRRFNQSTYREAIDYLKGLYDADDRYDIVEDIFAVELQREADREMQKQFEQDAILAAEKRAEKDIEAALLTEDTDVDPELPCDEESISFNIRNDSEIDQTIIVVYAEFKNRSNRITKVDLSIHTNSESADGERRSFERLSFGKARDLVLEAIGHQATNNAIGIE